MSSFVKEMRKLEKENERIEKVKSLKINKNSTRKIKSLLGMIALTSKLSGQQRSINIGKYGFSIIDEEIIDHGRYAWANRNHFIKFDHSVTTKNKGRISIRFSVPEEIREKLNEKITYRDDNFGPRTITFHDLAGSLRDNSFFQILVLLIEEFENKDDKDKEFCDLYINNDFRKFGGIIN